MRQNDTIADRSDNLSAVARELLRANSGSAFGSLTVQKHGTVREEVAQSLDRLTPQSVLHGQVADQDAAACTQAALCIWHDALQRGHEIVQRIEEPLGSYWHGIIHRLEGDFANARYWFARAGPLLIAQSLAIRVDDLMKTLPADKQLFRLTAQGWNPFAFVDLVRVVDAAPTDPRRSLVVAIQRVEWQTVFEYGLRLAAGK